jgi:SPP1 gp7 family putative phage head morphogenesis protein
MIARTEVANAQTRGNISIWQELGTVDKVTVLLSNAEGVCDECGDWANGGPYTLDEIQDEYPFHPNCRCTLIPHVEEES